MERNFFSCDGPNCENETGRFPGPSWVVRKWLAAELDSGSDDRVWHFCSPGCELAYVSKAFKISISPTVNQPDDLKTFQQELVELINKHSKEAHYGDTPDWILGEYIMASLEAWNLGTDLRERHYGRKGN